MFPPRSKFEWFPQTGFPIHALTWSVIFSSTHWIYWCSCHDYFKKTMFSENPVSEFYINFAGMKENARYTLYLCWKASTRTSDDSHHTHFPFCFASERKESKTKSPSRLLILFAAIQHVHFPEWLKTRPVIESSEVQSHKVAHLNLKLAKSSVECCFNIKRRKNNCRVKTEFSVSC